MSKGLPHVAAASERYRLALIAEEMAKRAKEDARENLCEVVGASFRSGAEVAELEPFHGAVSALHSYLRGVQHDLGGKLDLR